jgi:hypothetical protein
LEKKLNIVRDELSDKETKIEKTSHSWISKINNTEIERNKLKGMLETIESQFEKEEEYKNMLENKCSTLEQVYSNLELCLLSLDKGACLCFKSNSQIHYYPFILHSGY